MGSDMLARDGRRDDVRAMGEGLVGMALQVRDAFIRLDGAPLDEAARIGRRIHRQEQALIREIVEAAAGPPLRADEEVIFVPMHVERIADNLELLGAGVARMIRLGIPFTDRANREMRCLLDAVVELLEGLRDALRTGNRTLLRYVQDAGRSCVAQANEYALFHEQRLIEGVCQPEASSIYLAMIDHLKGVEWHARQVAAKLTPEAPSTSAPLPR
ncbi:MAG TPA: hypothetical protein VK911_05880 [Vicinamibacterales bacterium]|nr:hypothetical protein [Vicinamibacterales bacterium]